MFVETVQAARAAVQLWDRRNAFWNALRSVVKTLQKGKVRIVIFGAGGVGKTTLAELLSETDPSKVQPGPYQRSLDKEEKRLRSNVFGACYVAPGQADDVDSVWPELYAHLSKGKRAGVINVVSYGYHSFQETAYQEKPQFKPGMTKEQFMSAYRAEALESELTFLRRLKPHLKTAKSQIWALTVVTKQDLWWPDRQEVRKHYDGGKYLAEIREIQSSKGDQSFRHQFLSASLVRQNFGAAGPEVLAETAAGYDDNVRYANLQALIQGIETLAEG